MGTFEQFSTDIEDEEKRKKLYNSIKNTYDLPDFNGFSTQLGIGQSIVDQTKKVNEQATNPNMTFTQEQLDSMERNVPQSDTVSQQVQQHNMNTYGLTNPTDEQKEMIMAERENKRQREIEAQTRQQVADLTDKVDNALLDAKGESIQGFYDRTMEAAGEGILSSLQNAALMTAGAITPGDIQANIYGQIHRSEGIGTEKAQALNRRIRELEAAQRSMRDANRIIAEADHNAQSGSFGKWLESSFAGGAARGFGQKFFDVDTWDFGGSDLSDAGALMTALRAYDKGEELTESQQMLLDAKAIELATNAYFGSYVGRGYKAGEVTAESIPFMLEMCINPASGAGSSATAMMTRYALKRFGKKAVKDNAKKYFVAKAGTRVAGDIAGAATMSATTGAGRVAADTAQRMAGDVQFDTDEEGKSYFSGHTDGDDAGTAFAKAFANTTIENYSEMFGEYFSPITNAVGGSLSRLATSKAGRKIGLNYVNDFMDNVAASDVSRMITDFEKHAKWNGVFGEYAEEVAGNAMNALLVGDQNFNITDENGNLSLHEQNSVFNLDDNIDTFLGVSLMGGFMSAMKTAGYRTPKYRARQDMKAKDDAGAAIFGDLEKWREIRNTIAFGSDEDVKAKIADVLSDPDISQQQRAAVLEYAKSAETYKGMLKGEETRREEDDPLQVDAETSFDNGYSLEDEKEKNDAKNMLDYQRQRLSQIVSENFIQEIEKDPIGVLNAMRNVDSWTDEERQTVIDFVNAKAAYDGMIARVGDDIDSQISASNSLVDSHTNKEDDMVHPVTTTTDKKMYIVGGQVVMNADGTSVDTEKSLEANADGMLLAVDAETGKIVTLSVDDIASADAPIDAAEQKQLAQEQIRQQYAQQEADKIDGVLPFNQGDVYNVVADDGQQHTVQVLQDQGDGTVSVLLDGAQEPTVAAKDTIQAWADAANLARLQQFEQEKEQQRAQQAAAEAEAARPQYNLNDVLTLRVGDGSVRGSITAEPNADGQYEVYTDEPINGKKVNLFTRDELDSMLMEHNGNVAPQSQPTENNKAEQQEQQVEEKKEEEQRPAIERIPILRDENGKPVLNRKGKPTYQWHEAAVEDTADALTEQAGGSMLTARDVATDMVGKAKEQLEKVRKQKPKGDDPIELIESRNAIQQAEQQAQDIVKYWQDVNQEIQKRMREESARKVAEAEAAKSEQQRQKEAEEKRQQEERLNEIERQRIREQIEKDKAKRNKEYEPLVQARKEMASDPDALAILDDAEPRDLEEWVSYLLRPHSILWQDASENEVGLRSELGLKRGDMQRFMTLLGTKESGAKPFGKVVLDIYEGLSDAMKGQYTDQDVRNTLLELFNEGSSGRMMNLAKEHRIEEARAVMKENMRRDADAEMEAWADSYHLTPEERATFEDYMQQPPTAVDEEIINQIIADNEQNRRSEEVDREPVGQGEESEVRGSTGEVSGQGATEETGGNNEPAEQQHGQIQSDHAFVSGDDVAGREQALAERVVVNDDDWTEDSDDGTVYKRTITIDDAHSVTQVDEPNDKGDYTGSYFLYEGKRFGGLPEVIAYIDESAQLGDTSSADEIAAEEAKVDTNPSEAQKEAGNYKKGHIQVDGYEITIENPKGSVRSGVDSKGNRWETTMRNTYGYIRRTEGVDGDHIDVFLSDNPTSGNVFVIDQVNPETGEFDEHKVMYGFASEEEARKAYLSNYSKGWKGLGTITEVSREEFKKWVESSHRKTKPFAEYKSVKRTEGQNEQRDPRYNEGWDGDYSKWKARRDYLDEIERKEKAAAEQGRKAYYISATDGNGQRNGVFHKVWLKPEEAETGYYAGHMLWTQQEAYRTEEGFQLGNIYYSGEELTGKPAADAAGTVANKYDTADDIRALEGKTESSGKTGNVRGENGENSGEESAKPYTITPAQYTNKKGKTTDMQLVKFDKELTKEELKAGKELAKASRGWWDSKQGGFMMRDAESAQQLAEALSNEDAVQDAQPVSLTEMAALVESEPVKKPEEKSSDTVEYQTGSKVQYRNLGEATVTGVIRKGTNGPIEGVMIRYQGNNLQVKPNELSLIKQDDVAEQQNTELPTEQPQQEQSEQASEQKPKSKWVDDEDAARFEELKERLRKKMLGQLNMGVDPEIFYLGTQMAFMIVKHGARKFSEYAKAMIDEMGDGIRKQLKTFYNGARDMMEASDNEQENEIARDMDDYDTVKKFDVLSLGRETTESTTQPTVFEKAEQVAGEIEAEQQQKVAEEKMKEQRNDGRKAQEEGVALDGTPLRAMTAADLDERDVPTYYEGRRVYVMLVARSGEQVSATQFSEPKIDYIMLTNGKSVQLDDLMVADSDKPQSKETIEARKERWQGEAKKKAEEKSKKTSSSKKKDVSLQRDLFADVEPNNVDNGLQGNDELRTEGLPANETDSREQRVRANGKEVGQESGRPDGGRKEGSLAGVRHGNDVGLRSGKQLSTPQTLERPANPKNTHNNHAERGKDYAPRGVDARIEANIKAIELMQQLVESGKQATPEQMAVLRQFSGWGGLGKAFTEDTRGNSTDGTTTRLRALLGEEAYQQAVMSRNSAFYTPATVIDSMWDIARAMGFKGGNVLEGSAGIGNIIGQMPVDLSERSNIHAVEIDQTTGNILSLLYPDAQVDIQGFEKTQVENGSVDLAITNVPFVTGLRVNDTTGDKDLSKRFHDIHDFCIAKNIRKLKEGGIGIFITSSGTLDNSARLREWMIQEGGVDVVGAFRLNNETFGGTGATSDIIVVRKRVNGKKSPHAIDVLGTSGERTAEYDTGEEKKVKGVSVPVVKQLPMDYNQYFIEHPEMMAGKMYFGFEKGDTFRPTSKALYPVHGKNQGKMLTEWAQSFAEKDWDAIPVNDVTGTVTDNVYDELGTDVKEGSMVVDKKGNLCIAQRGKAVPLAVNANKVKGHTKVECFEAYQKIKKALADLLEYQTKNESDADLQPKLKALNKAYDDFVKTYGYLHKNTAISFLKSDVDFANILALETYKELGDGKGGVEKTYGKTDIFSKRVVEKEKSPEPKDVKDGIIASIYLHGRVDVPYISEQIGMSEDEVRDEIIKQGLGFENPSTRQIEVSYEYLSGNVREKLRQARDNNTDGRYDANIKALEEKVPMDIPAHLIDFSIGSSWIDPKLYEEFVKEMTDVDVTFTAAGGTWYMKTPYYVGEQKNRAMGVTSELLHKTIMGTQLIEAAMQNKTITVSETRKKWDGSTETIVDKEATQACANKIDEIRQEFKDWARNKMQSDPEMSKRIEATYNDMFNNYVPCSIPDEFVPKHFGGAATSIDGKPFELRPHQGKAVIRGTMQPLLLAHEVGSGKTYTLISTAMEMRRLGTARKPMIVVQNATVGQFVESAKELYPNAKVLTIEEADRTAEGRKNFYAKIKYNDWDMIVVPQSVFERIPDSEERQMKFVQDKIEEKLLVLEQMKDADPSGNSMIVKQAEKEIDKLRDDLAGLTDTISSKRKERDEKKAAVTRQNAEVKALEMLDRATDDVENFDDMGIDAILVDEAHEYKHLGFATAMQRGVKGVDPSYSKKAQGVFLKTQAVLEKNNGRNVVFATGTPISNTAAEIWTFMRYLMPADTMKEYGIYYFDDFVRNFGNLTTMLEFTTSGKFKENNRFAGYVNLPELVRIWSGVADTVLNDDIEADRIKRGEEAKIPEMEGGKATDIYLPQTKALRSVMKYVKAKLKEYDEMSGKEKKENSHIPLTMYGIAKAAAVDARLVVSDAADEPQSKTNEAVRQTLKSLEDTKDYKGTVAIFADNYQNKKSGFNLYEDIRKKLIDAGVPADQIVVMKSGMSVKKKLEIFEKVNRGEIRVILGSTFTLGTGVNIQERLHTLIHLDAPNRPMDYTQRNGRILRQGNIHKKMNKPVRVLRFGVEDSLDVTAYQRLKTKGAIADSIMRGKEMMQNSMENRALEEEEDVFGDTVAQLSGSEYAMLKNQAEKDVRKYESKKKQYEADQAYCHSEIPRLEKEIDNLQKYLKHLNSDIAKVEALPADKTVTIGKQTFATEEFDNTETQKATRVLGMDDFFKDYNKKIKEAENELRENPSIGSHKRELTVNIGGIDFKFKTELSIDVREEGAVLFTAIHRKMTYDCDELGMKDEPVYQSLLRNGIVEILNNVISGNTFRWAKKRTETQLESDERQLSQIKKRYGKPFEYTEELKKAHERYDEYSELMKKELEEKEKKYAEMDAEVEDIDDVTEAEEAEEEEEETDDSRFRDDEEESDESDYFHTVIDDMFTNPRFSSADHARERYDLGATPEWMKGIGISGDRFSLSFKNIKTHRNKDADHSLTQDEWHSLPKAIKTPFLVTKRKDADDKYRLYVNIVHNGKFVAVGVDVKRVNQGKDNPMLEVNSIKTVFGQKGKLSDNEEVIAYDQNITPKQEALLRDLDYREYPSIQELSAANVANNSEMAKDSAENLSEGSEYFREVDDEETIKRLESEPTIKVYRSMQLIDGKLYPPMSAKVDGKLRQPTELGKWEEAEERPEMADENGYFTLNKGNGKSLKARYNPYIHTSRTMLNDQFSEAQDRDNLVVVEMEVPVSELTSGYKAEKAKDSVGAKQWKAGIIQGQLTGTREVILSRWAKPVRIVPVEEVADNIADQIAGQVSVMPTNVVTPQQREALEERGIKFVETDNKGKIKEGVNVGKSWKSVYGKKRGKRTMQREGVEIPEGNTSGTVAGRTAARQRKAVEYAQRQWRRAHEVADEWVQKLGLADVIQVVDSIEEVEGNESFSKRKRRAKGWYDPKTGKIYIVLGNHRSPSDVLQTILHEAVGHYGLRKLFGQNFDTFLDNVYQAASLDVKERIAALAAKLRAKDSAANRARRTNQDYMRIATEEYLASLAEDTDFERATDSRWFEKIKELFMQMLRKIGLRGFADRGVELTDNELRYILWRSYKNMAEPGRYRNVFDVAENIAMEVKLGVGNNAKERARIQRTGRTDTSKYAAEGTTIIRMGNIEDEIPLQVMNRQDEEKIRQRVAHMTAAEALAAYQRINAQMLDEDGLNLDEHFEKTKRDWIAEHGINGVGKQQADELQKAMDKYGSGMVELRWELLDRLEELGVDVAEEGESDLFRDDEDVDADAEGYEAGRMTLEESITNGLIQLALNNKENVQLRVNAMKQIGGNLSKLRSAMARQREYDRSTVDSIVRLAKMVIDSGFFKNFSTYEVKRLMGMVNRAAGRENITKQASEVVDLLLNHQLNEFAELLHKQMKTKGSKLNNSGVEVQAGLDVDGQRMVAAMKDAMTLDEQALQDRMDDVTDRMGSDDETVAKNAAVEYQGLMLAKQYHDEIRNSEQEEKVLKMELKQAKEDHKAGLMTNNEYNQFVRETENAMRENRLERIEAYQRLISSLGVGLKESVERAEQWRDKEQQRVNEIHHNANSDLLGVPTDEHRQLSWMQRAANWSFVRFFMKPLATFDQMLRFFGSKSVNGQGYLWNRFMGGYTDASEREWKKLREAHDMLDAKVSEIFGKKMRWSDLFSMERKMPTVTVEFWDAGEKKKHELTQGNLLYIYMVNKMNDGRMKLRHMGITDEDVEYIKEHIDPRFLELADWIQDVFLKEKRKEYNEVHERMFGASMATIDNYFPLKINSRSRGQEEEIGEPTYSETKPATITGSIIKRTRNALPLDVTGADAFDVVLEHLQNMEHWAAFAELNRDMNTLLSYKRFRNRVMNMSSVRYGAGQTLWKNFKDVCAIAAGVYHPQVNRNSLDTAMVNVAKGVTAAKISFRLYTALKQLLSYPAYLSDANILELVKSTNPVGAALAWNWAIKELPGFAKRWQSKQAGDSRLSESDVDWQFWRNKLVKTASRLGMSPNAFVDALTVAMGAKAIYETRLKRYKTDGYSDEQAKEKALRDAAIAYNETQQSNEKGYLSAMQLDRTVASVALTVFRNASMGYQRRLFAALTNLKRKINPKYRAESIEFMKKQMVRDGLSQDQAQRAAERAYNRSWYKDIADVAIFGFVMQLAWNLGPYLPYLLMGGDDDDKDKMLEDAMMHALAGGVEGLSGGNVISELYNMSRKGENITNYNFNLLPLMSDIQNTMRHFKQDEVAAWNDVFNLLVQSGIGVNPQTITDAFVAVMDYANGDPKLAKETAMFIMRVMQVPQSQLDKMYIDELGMKARDAKALDAAALAQRYAEYKRWKGAPLTGWAYSDEGENKAEERYIKKFESMRKERLMSGGDPDVNAIIDEYKQGEYKESKQTLERINRQKLINTMEYGKELGEFAVTPEYRRYRIYNTFEDKINTLIKMGMYEKADELRAKLAERLEESSDK